MKNNTQGKCPKDGRKNRPIYIIINGNRELAVADGNGHWIGDDLSKAMEDLKKSEKEAIRIESNTRS